MNNELFTMAVSIELFIINNHSLISVHPPFYTLNIKIIVNGKESV